MLVSSSSTPRRHITDGGSTPSWNPFSPINGDHCGRTKGWCRRHGTRIHPCCRALR
ncbi:hypothetical protein [Actinoplanes xinjiangensis]|uniref:hypothetical protein n=1 Tax=Actinoplanes xinjiangensis TaxID=512350 RepID=UPI0034472E48